MPKYLLQVTYTSEGLKGLVKEGGSAREAAIVALAKSLGSTIEAYYYAFGDTDLYAITNAPDNVSMAAGALAAAASGAVEVKTTVLLTPEEVDAAVKKTAQYRAPGR